MTAAYGGRIRHGKIYVAQDREPDVGVHFRGDNPDNPYDGGTWTTLDRNQEGLTWMRGTLDAASPAALALLAAAVMRK